MPNALIHTCCDWRQILFSSIIQNWSVNFSCSDFHQFIANHWRKTPAWPGARWKEIILHLIIRNATCFRILHSSIHRSMWYLCTSFIWLQPYNKIQSGNMVSKYQHRPGEREFSSAIFLVPKCQPVWCLQSHNQKLQLINTNPVRRHYPYRRQCPHKINISILILLWWLLPSYSLRLIRIQTVLFIYLHIYSTSSFNVPLN